MISGHANVIDLAGPWEVFQDASTEDGRGFQLYTVSDTTEPVNATGGLIIVPNYHINDAPAPHVVSVGAQLGSASLTQWLKSVSSSTDLTLSVCTGAFQLARAGLLDGRQATTHHDFLDRFATAHPEVDLLRGPRFVETEGIATAAGLSSGIDLALRTVARYYGVEVASRTAGYMEYSGSGWLVPEQG
jgi:transcriptional regulator GlxA family with amidase domain